MNRALMLISGFVVLGGFCLLAPCYAGEDEGVLAGPAELLHQKAVVPPVAPFVSATRPDPSQLNYVPLGHAPAQPPAKLMSPDQVKAMEMELDQLRLKGDKISGRPSAPLATKSVTGDPLRPAKPSSSLPPPTPAASKCRQNCSTAPADE
jgi:hypothetical protein